MTTELTKAAQQALEALSLAMSDVEWRKDSPTQPVIHKAYNQLRRALTTSQPAQAGADEVFLPRRLAATHKLTQLGYRYDHMQGQWLPTQPAAQATPDVPETDFGNMATQQAAGEPVGEHVATVAEVHMSRYTLEWNGKPYPEGTKLFTHPAPGAPEDVQRNAARWEEVLRQVGADRQCGGFRFTLYNLRPIPGSNPMQGAVCQHFTQAVDAMLADAQAKGGEHV